MSQLPKKVAVVSGGSKGLGLGICKMLLAEGYHVATFSRGSTPELEQLIVRGEGRLMWEAVDICDDEAVAAFARNVKEKLGRIGYLVNSAGMANEGLLTMMKSKDVARLCGCAGARFNGAADRGAFRRRDVRVAPVVEHDLCQRRVASALFDNVNYLAGVMLF